MPFNGSGTFTRLYSWVVDAANGVDISSSRTDAEMNGFAAGLTNCITRDGQSPPSADIPWGGKKITNLGLATTSTDALSQAAGDARYVLASGTSLSFLGSISVASTLTVGGATSISGNLTVGTNTGGATSVLLNGAAGNARGFGWQIAGSYVADISLQNDDVTVTHSAPNTHNFNISGTQVAAITSAGLGVTGTISASGFVTSSTPTAGDNSNKLATTAFVTSAIATAGGAPLNSPAFTGTPTAPTASAGTSTTQIATTAFVTGAKNPAVQSVASASTVTPTFSNDLVDITAQAAALTLANPSGTAVNGWGIVIRIKDNGSAQTIAYGTQYKGIGLTLPTTTVAGKVLTLGGIWNANLTRLEIVSAAQE